MPKKVDLNGFANGALAEKLAIELQRVYENIADPNTDPKKARKVTVDITFKGDEQRDVISASVVAKSKLIEAKPTETKIMLDFDAKGNVVGSELKSGVKGQTFIDDDGDVSDDDGTKIINFKKQEGVK